MREFWSRADSLTCSMAMTWFAISFARKWDYQFRLFMILGNRLFEYTRER